MAKNFYTASEVDELLKKTKEDLLTSVDSVVTMSPNPASPVKFNGDGMHIRILRTEERN